MVGTMLPFYIVHCWRSVESTVVTEETTLLHNIYIYMKLYFKIKIDTSINIYIHNLLLQYV